ncbi:hypothetical protein [Saccharothrix stipae]
MVAEGVGNDRGGHLRDVLAERGGAAGNGRDAELVDECGQVLGV